MKHLNSILTTSLKTSIFMKNNQVTTIKSPKKVFPRLSSSFTMRGSIDTSRLNTIGRNLPYKRPFAQVFHRDLSIEPKLKRCRNKY
jgi:hypothetical protein